jgi:ankyrin repeat protein
MPENTYNFIMNTRKILGIILCLYVLIGCASKAEKDQSVTQTGKKLAVPPIPQTILDILETEPDNYSYELVKIQLGTFRMGIYSVSLAMEQAIYSGNEELIAEIIKHYKGIFDLWNGTSKGYNYLTEFEWKYIDICSAAGSNINIVRMLLDSGLDITHDHGWNEVAGASETILARFASENDDPAVLQLLIDHGARVNVRVDTPRGWPETFYEFSSVYQAAAAGKAGNLQLLIDNGGNIHLRGFMTDKTPLIAAAESGSHECVAILLKAGADVMAGEKYNRTALMEAAASGNERSVALLLEYGAIETIDFQDSRGCTALMEAAISGNQHSLKMLIDNGADVNMVLTDSYSYANTVWYMYGAPSRAAEGGQTALMMASTYECVKMLLESGAGVNAMDRAGRNALLFHCFFYRDSKIIQLLIDAGSYLYLDKDNGKNLLYLTRAWSDYEYNSEITDMLIKAGCIDDNPNNVYDYENYDYYFLPDRH